jgi:transcription elongation GreA/GreB family factor
MMKDLKQHIHELCLQEIQKRIDTAETALAQSREASNDDTKSSAGDKFETTREMMQQDITRSKILLSEAQSNLQILESILSAPSEDVVRIGSLVYTNNGIFYMSVSIGQLKYEGVTVYAISVQSPVGKSLLAKKVKDKFSFNQREYIIDQIL